MNETPKITLSNATHRETPVVKLEFAYNPELIDELKARTNARWSANMNCWYIPKAKFVLKFSGQAMRTGLPKINPGQAVQGSDGYRD